MSHRRRRLLVALILAAGIIGLAGAFASGLNEDDWLFSAVAVELLTVGGLLVLRVPDNRVSWLLFGLGTTISIMGWAEWLFPGEVSDVVVGLILFGIFVPGLSVFVPLWFPTGRSPSPPWNWVAWLCSSSVVLLFVGMAIVAWVENGDTDMIEGCHSIGTCSTSLGLVGLLGASVAAICSFVVRWRSSTGVESQQLRWLIPSFLVLGVGFLAEFGGLQESWIALTFGAGGMLLVPVSIGFAITRYRLYEIDRIISRTVSYGLVVGLLAVVFAAGVVWVPNLLPGLEDSSVSVALSTLAVAALFNPSRQRVQNWVDRRFNRSRYDAELVVEAFVESLRDGVGSGELVDGWIGVVTETVQPASASVWVRA